MMPKLKREHASECEARASGSNSERTSVSASVDNHSEQQQQQPAKKKLKSALNFSIESIMQSATNQANVCAPVDSSHLVAAAAEAMQKGLYNQVASRVADRQGSSMSQSQVAGWPSMLMSSASSTSSSRSGASSAISNNSRGSSQEPSFGSPASPLSRASTPISPGGNPNSNHHNTGAGNCGNMSSSGGTSGSSSMNKNNVLANNNPSASSPNCNSRLSQVECQLDNKDMWDKFHSLNTEMIITKTGRRMFPVMKVQFHNLDPNARYAVSMDIVPVDNKRYRYAYHKSCWQVAGKADPSAEPRLYPHPDSPFNGDLLARQVISFEKVKLTNNEMDKSGHIILNSMHKYQPRVHLIELKVPPTATSSNTQAAATSKLSTLSSGAYNHHHNHHNSHHNHNKHQQQQPQLNIEGYRTFVFPETVFTAVTAYQNQLITKMKIDKNPFAKGFRDSSRLSDLDRNDPFDYMGSLGPSNRFVPGAPPGAPGSLEAAAGAHMDAYQLLASAANNPWYSAAAVAAAAGGGNPFSPMSACSTAQAAQLQATQMWLAAFSACLNSAGPPGAGMLPPGPPIRPSPPHLDTDGLPGPGGNIGGGSSSSSANSSGTST